ncbi:hypothetical protein CHUAL_008699 [Chamberlinius hualienensis]
MGLFKIFLIIGALSALAYYLCPCCHEHTELQIVNSGWWGKGSRATYNEDQSIRKFSINVSDKVLEVLKVQLKATVYPEPLENANFEYGFNSDYLKTVVDYWINKYDWKKQEAKINSFSHFKTQIDGIDVHFMHVKPKSVGPKMRVLPLIMVHGWPGSFVEFLEIVHLLTKPHPERDFIFEVVVPSIPGYGFSSASHQKGFNQMSAAYVFDKLMQRLGYSYYYTHGGDWGSLIVQNMALQYPERVKALHMTVAMGRDKWTHLKTFIGTVFPSLVVDDKDYSKLYPLKDQFLKLMRESGYMHIQATKPDTVGIALANSPAGLAAYILEKFSTWTTPEGPHYADGLLTKKFNLDQLLTNVMIYYVTNSITSSVRFYKEWILNSYQQEVETYPIHVPTGIASFPNEILQMPRNYISGKYLKLISYNDLPSGGHFAAFEEPELLANDIWKFVEIVEKLPKSENKK